MKIDQIRKSGNGIEALVKNHWYFVDVNNILTKKEFKDTLKTLIQQEKGVNQAKYDLLSQAKGEDL